VTACQQNTGQGAEGNRCLSAEHETGFWRATGDCQQNSEQGADGNGDVRTQNRVLRATGDCQQNTGQGAEGNR
jgi:hypothetical protein